MKNTNKALFSSVVALILCCSMLVGTTFAWFTDEVKSGVNQIVAGNLDVELYHQDKAGYGKVDTTTTLFDDVTLWEPGAVTYENLTVANEGNLALKYELAINFTDAVDNGNGKTLADVLQVGVVPGGIKTGASREETVAAVQTWQPMKSFIKSGELLEKGKTDVYGIVIYWLPGTNDNDYNMNNGQTTVLSINLGVNLHAWQKDAEKDSFDETYDAVVHSEAQLAEALQNGGKIKVGSDIEATKTLTVPAGITATVYLNGKTLTGTTGRDADNNRVHVVKNEGTLTIVGGTVTSAGTNGGSAVINYGEMTIEDATLNGAPQAGSTWPSYTVNNYGVLTVNNSTVVGAQGVIATNVDTAVTTVNNVVATRNGWDGSGHVFYTQAGELIVNGGIYTNNANGVDGMIFASGKGVTTYVNGGTFEINDGAYFALSKDTNLIVTAGDFTDIKSIIAWGGTMTVSGGTFAVDPSKYLAAGYVAVKNTNGSYMVLPGDVAVADTNKLIEAIKAGQTNIALAPGNYTMPDGSDVDLHGKSLTITGTKDTVIETSHVDERDQFVTGANLKFEGVSLNFGAANYMGFANAASLTYEDCAINGLQFCYGSGQYSFINCDLNSNGAEHCVWTWGCQNVSFTDCDFTYGDRAVNCYGEGVTTNASFTNCTFTKVAGAATSGAIETNSSALTALNLTINNCTVNEGDLWWISTWDAKNGANTLAVVDGKYYITSAERLRELAANATGEVEIVLYNDITLGDDTTQKSMGAYFPNATKVTIDGNNNSLTLKGKMPGHDWNDEYYAGIIAPNAVVTVKNLTIVNEKLDELGMPYSSDRESVYTMVRGTSVLFENVKFDGGIQVKNNTKFVNCSFKEDCLVADANGNASNGMFCVFIDFEWTATAECTVDFENCTFDASGYGCVKLAGDKGAKITVNVKGCSFNNTCPSNYWSVTTPKYDVKMTGVNTAVNDLGGNTWAKGYGEG